MMHNMTHNMTHNMMHNRTQNMMRNMRGVTIVWLGMRVRNNLGLDTPCSARPVVALDAMQMTLHTLAQEHNQKCCLLNCQGNTS